MNDHWLKEMRDHAINSAVDAIGIAASLAILYAVLRIAFGIA